MPCLRLSHALPPPRPMPADRKARSLPGFLALLLALALPSPGLGHAGEDHAAAAAAEPSPPPIATRTGSAGEGSSFQVVLVPEGPTTLLYLADADSNLPIAHAVIDADAGGWQGQATATPADGVYRLDWSLPQDRVDVALVISAGGRDDLVLVSASRPTAPTSRAAASATDWRPLATAGGAAALLAAGLVLARRRRWIVAALVVGAVGPGSDPALAHGDEDHGAPPAASAPQTQPGTPVAMPKAEQFLLGIRTEKVEARAAVETVRVVGWVIPDPSGFARVQPSQPARILSDPAFPIPVPGQTVRRGQVLAVLEPTLSMLEKGDKRALLSRVDSEIALQQRELARLERLDSLVPAKQVETVRIRLDQLRQEKKQIAGTALGRELLVAPVDGVVADVHVVPGEVVTPDRALIEIVDPRRLRIDAVIHDLPLARRISRATAETRQLPGEVFTLTALGVSPKIDARDQGVHALFQVAPDQAQSLRVGMPVDVFLATGAARMRTAVPRDALAEVGGRRAVFVRTTPETFEARPVKVERLVGTLAEIAEGVVPGDRVVVQGVEQLGAGR